MHHYRDYKNGCPTDSVIELFSLLPFLKNLSLFSKIQQHHDHDHGGFYVYEVDRLSRALYPLRDTFETLTLVLNSKKLPWASDGVCIDGIRNLHCFKAMKNLCIQSPYLIGWRNEWPHPAESAKSLGQLLPPNLKDLTIHCCAIENFDERRIADHFQTPLDDKLSTQSFGPSQDFAWRDRRVIKSVVVCTQHSKSNRSRNLVRFHREVLESCFDIVGSNVDSGDEE